MFFPPYSRGSVALSLEAQRPSQATQPQCTQQSSPCLLRSLLQAKRTTTDLVAAGPTPIHVVLNARSATVLYVVGGFGDRTSPPHLFYRICASLPNRPPADRRALLLQLIGMGANVHERFINGSFPTRQVIEQDDVESLKCFVEYGRASLQDVDAIGATLLMHAARFGSLSCMQYLLLYNEVVDGLEQKDAMYGLTALHCCIRQLDKTLACARLLLDHGANVDAVDNGGRTAYMIVRSVPTNDVMAALSSLLMDRGTDITLRDHLNRTAQEIADKSSQGFHLHRH